MKTYLQSRGEFNHFLCLDISQAVHTGNTITNWEHTTSLLKFSRGVSSQNSLLKNRGDLGSTLKETFPTRYSTLEAQYEFSKLALNSKAKVPLLRYAARSSKQHFSLYRMHKINDSFCSQTIKQLQLIITSQLQSQHWWLFSNHFLSLCPTLFAISALESN